jgi:hypothetical protein
MSVSSTKPIATTQISQKPVSTRANAVGRRYNQGLHAYSRSPKTSNGMEGEV